MPRHLLVGNPRRSRNLSLESHLPPFRHATTSIHALRHRRDWMSLSASTQAIWYGSVCQDTLLRLSRAKATQIPCPVGTVASTSRYVIPHTSAVSSVHPDQYRVPYLLPRALQSDGFLRQLRYSWCLMRTERSLCMIKREMMVYLVHRYPAHHHRRPTLYDQTRHPLSRLTCRHSHKKGHSGIH